MNEVHAKSARHVARGLDSVALPAQHVGMTDTSIPTIDVRVENHGSIFLFRLITPSAREWVAENVGNDAQYFGRDLAVEHRYAQDLAQGMTADGLEVR